MNTNHLPLKLLFSLGWVSLVLQGCETDGASNKSSAIPVTAVIHQDTNPSYPAPTVSNQVPARLSPNVEEVAKLLQTGVSEEVMVNYILNSPLEYEVTADEIVYLTDLGASDTLIQALIDPRSSAFETRVREIPPGQQPGQQNAPAPEPGASLQPPSQSAEPAVQPNYIPEQTEQVAQQSQVQAQQPEYVVVENAQPENSYPEARPYQTNGNTQPASVEVHHYFHDSLDPYGRWVSVDNYGWCWSPTVAAVNLNWQPYYDRGRWVYTNQGWYWKSYYSWGHIPFHYGRWHRNTSHGWVWVPGYDWAPAWVHWRSHNHYAGWAPLPPGAQFNVGIGFTYYSDRVGASFGFGLGYSDYAWVDYGHFHHPRPWQYRVAGHQQQEIYNNSTVNNNYIVGDNNVIINNGVDITKVETASRQEIHKVQLRDLDRADSQLVRPEQLDSGNNSMAVYRPRLEAPKESKVTGGGGRLETRKPEAVSSNSGASSPQSARMLSNQGQNSRAGLTRSTESSAIRPNPSDRSTFSNAARPAQESRVRPSPSSSRSQTSSPGIATRSQGNTVNPSKPSERPGSSAPRTVSPQTQRSGQTMSRTESRKAPVATSPQSRIPTRIPSNRVAPQNSSSRTGSTIRSTPVRPQPTVSRSPYTGIRTQIQPTIVRHGNAMPSSSTRITPNRIQSRNNSYTPQTQNRIQSSSPSRVIPNRNTLNQSPTVVRRQPVSPQNSNPRIIHRSTPNSTRIRTSSRLETPTRSITPRTSAMRSSPPTRSIQSAPSSSSRRISPSRATISTPPPASRSTSIAPQSRSRGPAGSSYRPAPSRPATSRNAGGTRTVPER